MRILTIDASSHVGWAYSSPDFAQPIFGSKDFREYAGVDGRVHYKYMQWLREHIRTAEPDVIVIESPFFRGANSEFLYGFSTITAMCAFEGGWKHQPIQLEKIHLSHAKKHVTGRGDADKEAVMRAVQDLGFAIRNDHEADAVAIMQFKLAHTANHTESPGKTVSLRPRVLNALARRRKGVA